jgi:imidazole glycerol-phosphate synthase subunit HisH
MSRAPVIVVLDYGMGNRRSVQKALEHVGAEVVLTAEHRQVRAADALVVPGVGAFPLAMRRLQERDLIGLIKDMAADGKPLLGICLGMQLLFEGSLELEPTKGLGILAGQVTPLRTAGLRVPHIGWNEVRFERQSAFAPQPAGASRPFYHVHSLAARPARAEDVLATTCYGERFATIVERDNVFGVQFHPEKSSSDGLALLRGFVALCQRGPTRPQRTVAARA